MKSIVGEAMESVLAQHNALYMHGHLHETRVEYTSKGGSEFLNLQAGAVFDSRDARERPNTIMIFKYDDDAGHVSVEPYSWSPSANQWSISTQGMPERLRIPGESCWRFPLPTPKSPRGQAITKQQSLGIPTRYEQVEHGRDQAP